MPEPFDGGALTPEGRTRTKNPFRFFFDTKAKEGYVPNREATFYTLALSGQNATYNLVASWLFYFCTNVLHISPVHAGTVMSIGRIWDGINDPLVGAYIDRQPLKNGQKLHRYLGKLPILIGLLTMLLFVDFGVGESAAIAIVLFVYLLWDMTYSFQDVALWGTLSLISPYSRERERITQWLNIGASAGAGLVGLMPMILGMKDALHTTERTLFLFVGIVLGFGGELVSIFAYKTRERVFHPPASQEESLFKSFTILRHNKIMLLLMAAQIFSNLSITVPWIYFFKYCVSYQIGGTTINGESFQFWYSLVTAIPGTFALFIATKLCSKMGGMRKALIVAQCTNIAVRVAAYFVGYETLPQMIVVMALMAASSLPTGVMGIATRSLICDSIDYVEWKTGKRTEGIVCSAQNFTAKITTALAVFINGAVLSALHFDGSIEGIAGQTDLFYKMQWPLFMLGPIIGAVLYLIPIFIMRYTPEQKAKIEAELEERRKAEKEAEASAAVKE